MPLTRATAFCQRFGLRLPVLLAPMGGACPPSLSIAIANAGGLGACGAVLMRPDEIRNWAETVRGGSNGAFQMNIWIPDKPPARDAAQEARLREFLGHWGPPVAAEAAEAPRPEFAAQCDAILAAGPPIVSFIMGLYPLEFVARMKALGIAWFATVTTVAEAKAAEAAGADVVVARGAEAGGHRGSFDPADAERRQVGLFALLPAVVDAVGIPVVANRRHRRSTGCRGRVAAGCQRGADRHRPLRCPEAGIASAWADAIGQTAPEDTILTRAFSGRAGRSIATDFVCAAHAPDAPAPAPYPVQRALTTAMRTAGLQAGDLQRMQVRAGQSAALARAEPTADVVRRLWDGVQALLK